MTEIINKYSNSKIYKICSNLSDKYYIGSTFKRIEQRLKEHITSYKAYLTNNDKTYLSSYKILQHSDYYIELLELYPCNNMRELHCREGELIKQFKSDLVNLHIPCEFIIKKKQEEIEQRLKPRIIRPRVIEINCLCGLTIPIMKYLKSHRSSVKHIKLLHIKQLFINELTFYNF